jgi:hypothetical protein
MDSVVGWQMATMVSFGDVGQTHPALFPRLGLRAAPPFLVLGAKHQPPLNFTRELNNILMPFYEPEIKNIMANFTQKV